MRATADHNASMPTPLTLWQRCVGAVQSLLFPRFWLAVIEQEPLRLVFSSDNREVIVMSAPTASHEDSMKAQQQQQQQQQQQRRTRRRGATC